MGKSGKPVSPARRKQIIADYCECQNYSEVARNHDLSVNGVKKIVLADPHCAERCKQKAEEHTRDALESLDSRSKRMVELVDKLLDAMDEKATKPDMFTNIKDLATAFGIVVDKMVKAREISGGNNGDGVVRIVDDIK